MTVSENYIVISDEDRKKARGFFDRAISVGGAGQFEFAIEMWLNGLRLDPDAVEAHQGLRDIALRRKASGGKKIGMLEAMKYPTKGKDERTAMLNAERLLSFDPGDTGHMLSLLETAYRAGCYDTALWIGPILAKANNELAKPDYAKFEKVRDIYAKLGRWSMAVEVCTRMLQMRPDDMDLKNDLKNLSANEAMEKGKYSKSYRESVRDMSKQADLLAQERDVVSEDYTAKVAREAEADMRTNPDDPSKVSKYVEALKKIATPDAMEKAAEVLASAYERTGAFKFRLQLIDLRLIDLRNQEKALRAKATGATATPEGLQEYKEFKQKQNEEELELFNEVAEQYPTESKYKYEVAIRMVALHRYIDAIPLLQNAVNDPKLRVRASLELGKTFLLAEFPDESADTLKSLSETYPTLQTGDETAKEIMYWLGRAEEAKGDKAEALKAYSMVVKWDFVYRDTQVRMKKLRAVESSN
jgi:tetratricopeptide (TPR) repeat protein